MSWSWSDIGELIKDLAPFFTAGAAWFAAWTAWRGLNRWRAETIGKRKAEIAEEVLADFYEARDIINPARSPGSLGGEGGTRQRFEWETEEDTRMLDAYFRTTERLSKNAEFFAKLDARRYRFIAVFGKESAKPTMIFARFTMR